MANNLRDIVVAVKVDTAAYQREMNRLSRMSGDYLKLVEQGGKRIDAAYQRNSAALAAQNASVGEATQVVAVYARSAADVFSSTAKILQYADSWTALNSRLQLVTNGAAAFQEAQSGVFNAAQQARVPLQATAELYQGIARNQDALGLSGQQMASVVETMGKSIALSGTSSAAAGAALSQLGQAFSAGTLNGEQLNAVMQQAPGLAMAIAQGLGMPISEVRALGAAGLLTAEQVIGAVESMARSVDAQFASMPASVGGAFTVLENAVIAWVGHTDEATGASKVLSDGLLALSEHVDDAAFIAGAAAVGALTAKLGQSGVQAVQATKAFVENRLELQSQAKAQMLASQAAERKAQNIVFLAEKEAIAARGTAVQTSMELQLAQARMASRSATVAATAATTQYAAVSSTAGLAGRAILGVLGGPVGLAVSLASVAAGWLMFRDNAAEATQSMTDMHTPLDEVAKKYRELNALERDKARRGKQSQIVEAQGSTESSFKALTRAARTGAQLTGQSTFASFQSGIEAVHADQNLNASQASEQIQAQIDAYVQANPAVASYRDQLVEVAAQYIKNRELLERSNAEMAKIDGAQSGAAASASALGEGLNAIGKELGGTGWENYLKNLESARDVIGMTSSQIAEYQARSQGANETQAALAGTLSLQAETANVLKKATADKDGKAIEGAKATLLELVKVEAQQRAIIAAAAEAKRLQDRLTGGSMSQDEYDQAVGKAYTGTYANVMELGTARTNLQISGVAGSPSAETPNPKSGPKSGPDWASWARDREAEIAGQRQLAEAYLQGGDAVEKATMARRVENEVLKFGASHRADIVKLEEEGYAASLMVDSSKRLADMQKEIALINAKTEAERMLWETQSGAYASLEGKTKDALVAASAKLDSAREKAAGDAYIGKVNGSADAEQQKQKIGWLDSALVDGKVTIEQYQKSIDELTGKGVSALTEFAVKGAKNIQAYLGDALYDAVNGKFEGLGARFAEMLTRMATDAAAAGIGELLFGDVGKTNQIGGLFGSVISGIGGLFGGGGLGSATAANVAAAGSGLMFFANGGAFSNGVVDSPVAFPVGVMGEAGPEAIMPLQRGADGSLGIRAQLPNIQAGPAADAGGVAVNVYIQQDGSDRTDVSSGSEQFGRGLGEVVKAYVKQELGKSFKPGGMNWNALHGRA